MDMGTDILTAAQYVSTMREEELLQTILGAARLQGWLTYHTRSSKGSDAGFPDLVALGSKVPCLLVAELKSAESRVTPAQAAWLDRFAALPNQAVRVYLWRPDDLDEALAILNGREPFWRPVVGPTVALEDWRRHPSAWPNRRAEAMGHARRSLGARPAKPRGAH